MNIYLRSFIQQYLRVVLATLVPVILIAFMSIPVSLGGHPGVTLSANAPFTQHMT
jgi:hypothetical protein